MLSSNSFFTVPQFSLIVDLIVDSDREGIKTFFHSCKHVFERTIFQSDRFAMDTSTRVWHRSRDYRLSGRSTFELRELRSVIPDSRCWGGDCDGLQAVLQRAFRREQPPLASCTTDLGRLL